MSLLCLAAIGVILLSLGAPVTAEIINAFRYWDYRNPALALLAWGMLVVMISLDAWLAFCVGWELREANRA